MFDTNPNDDYDDATNDYDDANNDYDDANEDYDGILAWSMFDTVRLREFTRRAKNTNLSPCLLLVLVCAIW